MVIEGREIVGDNVDVFIEGGRVDMVSSIKYLGVIIDNRLNFNEHVDYVCKKISKKLGFFYRCATYLSPWTRKIVYNTLILPHFNYASTVLYLTSKANMERLQLLQNRAMRIILQCNRYTSIHYMLNTLNWFNIETYLEINSLKFINKIRSQLAPKECNQRLKTFNETHNHNTRHKNNFILDHKNKKKTQNSIFFKAASKFNTLPEHIKDSRNMSEFNRKIKEYYRAILI